MRRGNKGNRDEKSKKERWKSRKKGDGERTREGIKNIKIPFAEHRNK